MHLQKPLAESIRHIYILVNVIISFQVFKLKTSHNSSVLPGVFEETPFHHMLEFWTEVRSTAHQARDGNNHSYAGMREKHRRSQHSFLSFKWAAQVCPSSEVSRQSLPSARVLLGNCWLPPLPVGKLQCRNGSFWEQNYPAMEYWYHFDERKVGRVYLSYHLLCMATFVE